MISQNARSANREASVEERLRQLELTVNQQLAHAGPGNRIFARINWNYVGVNATDSSQCQLTDRDGTLLPLTQLGWIETARSCVPVAFGNFAIFEIERSAKAFTPTSLSARPRYRAIRLVGGPNSNAMRSPYFLDRTAAIAGNNQDHAGKILDDAGSAIQTTISGSATDNVYAFWHPVKLAAGARVAFAPAAPFFFPHSSGPDQPRLASACAAHNSYRAGKSFGTDDTGTIIATSTQRIDHGDELLLQFIFKITATNQTSHAMVNWRVYWDTDGKLRVAWAGTDFGSKITVTGASPVNAVTWANRGSAQPYTVDGTSYTYTYNSTVTVTEACVYEHGAHVGDIAVSFLVAADGHITSIQASFTNVTAGFGMGGTMLTVFGGG